MAAVVRTASRTSMGKGEPPAKSEKPKPPPPQPPAKPPQPPARDDPRPSTSGGATSKGAASAKTAAARKRHDSQGRRATEKVKPVALFHHLDIPTYIFSIASQINVRVPGGESFYDVLEKLPEE